MRALPAFYLDRCRDKCEASGCGDLADVAIRVMAMAGLKLDWPET
jgi:hypothetical protein